MTAAPLKVSAPMPKAPDPAPATSLTSLSRVPAPTSATSGRSPTGQTPPPRQPSDPYLAPALQAVARARARTAEIRAAKEQLGAQAAARPWWKGEPSADGVVAPPADAVTAPEAKVSASPAPAGISVAQAARASRASKVHFRPGRGRSGDAPYRREYRPAGLVTALSITAPRHGPAQAKREPPAPTEPVAPPARAAADTPSAMPPSSSPRATSQALAGPSHARPPMSEVPERSAAAGPPRQALGAAAATSAAPARAPATPPQGPFGRHVPLPLQPPSASDPGRAPAEVRRSAPRPPAQAPAASDVARRSVEAPPGPPPPSTRPAEPVRPGGPEDQPELVLSEVVEPAPPVSTVTRRPPRAIVQPEAESTPETIPTVPSPPPSSSPRRFSRTIAAVEERRATIDDDQEPWSYVVPRPVSQGEAEENGQRRWLPWPRRKGTDD